MKSRTLVWKVSYPSDAGEVSSLSQGAATTSGIGSVVVTGGQLNILPRDSTICQQMSTSPPPLIRASVPCEPTTNPFALCFVRGNIRVCHGCRQRYPKPSLPPLDLCVKHQEWQHFGPRDNQQTRYGP